MSAEALHYWRLATQYLDLTEAVSTELVRSGNPWVIVASELSDAQYRDSTTWSDHRIGVAVLFNFYHGVELVLKDFLALGGSAPPLRHRLTMLLSDFQNRYPDTEIGRLVSVHVSQLDSQSPLGRFFAENNLEVDSWYQALRYPESSKGQLFDHVALRYGNSDALGFWEGLARAARDIRVASVRLARSLGA